MRFLWRAAGVVLVAAAVSMTSAGLVAGAIDSAATAGGVGDLFGTADDPAVTSLAGTRMAPLIGAGAADADTAELRRVLERIAATHAGVVGISVRNLNTMESLSIRGDETFPSASLVKVAILVTLLDEVAKEEMRLDEQSTMIARDQVGGSGVINRLHSGTEFTLEDLAWLMITLSDNTATNLLLDKLDIATVGEKMEALELPHTDVHSKTFRRQTSIAMDSSKLYGFGVMTPNETTQLFTLLYQGRAVSPALDSLALRMLFANQDYNMMVRWLPGDTRVAHKTGSVDETRNDCGIMYSPAAPIALCVMTRENEDTSYAVDSAAHLLIARIARAVYSHYNPDAELPELPVITPDRT